MKHVEIVDAAPSHGSLQLTWLTRLTAANALDEVTMVIVDLAQDRPGRKAAIV
ncbi:MAG TPA: hypothetical protein VGC19_15870 [Rhodanobacter sp.]